MKIDLRDYIVDRLYDISHYLSDNKINDIEIDWKMSIKNLEQFFSNERIEDIIKFRQKGYVSKEIYNFAYLVLTKKHKYDKEYIIKLLKPKVDEQIDLFLKINIENVKSCENCLSRNNCFDRFNKKVCDFYKPGPTYRPDYWPEKNLGGMYWL